MNLETQPISNYLKRHFKRHRTEGREEGRAEGMVRMLERLLDCRGLAPSDEQRRHIAASGDEAQLQRWFDRAVTAQSVAEVFDT